MENSVWDNVTKTKGGAALQWAAWNGCHRITQILISTGVDVNSADRNGRTVLHKAAFSGHNKVVQILLSSGADVNITDISGRTALHWAGIEGHNSVVQTLVASQAHVNTTDINGRTALHWAAEKGHNSLVQTLTASGADVNKVCNDGLSALWWAVLRRNTDVVQTLIDGGADVNVAGIGGGRALHYAADAGHSDLVKTLTDAGADVNAVDTLGRTALHWTAAGEQNSIVNTQVIPIVTPKALYPSQKTNLLVEQRKDSVLQDLIAAGADANVADQYGRTALHWAVEGVQHRAIPILIEAMDDERRELYLIWAAQHGHFEVVKSFIEAGVNILTTNKQGQVALQLALQEGHDQVVHLLTPYMTNHKTLHQACRSGNNLLLKWYLEHSHCADIDIPDNHGQTALHMAVTGNSLKIVRILLEWSADPWKVNSLRQSAFDLVEGTKDAEIREELLQTMDMGPEFLLLDDMIINHFKNNVFVFKQDIVPLSDQKNHLINGYVNLKDHKPLTVHQELEKVVKNTVSLLNKTSWLRHLKLNFCMVGGSKENTKIKEPNEFDYLITAEAGNQFIVSDNVCGLPVCPPGFAYLEYSELRKMYSRAKNKTRFLNNGCISCSKVQKYVWQKLVNIFYGESGVFTGVKYLELKYKPERGYLESKACSTVTLTWTGREYTGMDIGVDLTFALKFNFTCPFLAPNGQVPNHFYLVPKPPHKDSLLGLAYDTTELEVMWKVDFVGTESEMVANFPQITKDAYITCKCIRAILPALSLPGSLKHVQAEKIVSSFMMKLLFMKNNETFKTSSLSLEQMVLEIFNKLVWYLENEYLPDLWSFRIPYCEDFEEVEAEDMTAYGQANILAGSKRDIKHCLQVARLLRFITKELVDYDGVIKKAIQQEGHCTYATLRVYEACSEGDVELADKLLECGAVFNIPNNEGLTPLDLARAAGHSSMVEWLLSHDSNNSKSGI